MQRHIANLLLFYFAGDWDKMYSSAEKDAMEFLGNKVHRITA
jgi:hypothetical protein